jgi:hypothetical protein
VAEYDDLLTKAQSLQKKMDASYQDAYFQLILHPVSATANLYRMYYAVAKNKELASQGDTLANFYARQVRNYYNIDSMITLDYHKLNNGKWNHMMSQTHIGYTYWQQPAVNRMPTTEFVFHYNQRPQLLKPDESERTALSSIPGGISYPVFYEKNGMACIYADHFSGKMESPGITWKVLPNHGRTGNGITTFPVTHQTLKDINSAPWLEYDLYTYSKDTVELHFYLSPTLNFLHHPNGLQFAVSINGSAPQIYSINQKDYDARTWEGWVASNTIIVKSGHRLNRSGKQTIRYWPLHPGIIMQKIVCDFGGLKPSFLGPEETMN